MELGEWLTVLAVLLGPIIAVRLTRHLDESKEVTGRKLRVFKTLMATRAQGLSAAHVEALNSIELEFQPKKDKEVLAAWREYLDFLGESNQLIGPPWNVRRVDLLTELLFRMSIGLKYNLDKTSIKNSIYAPTGHFKLEDDQAAIRKGLRELLEGNAVLPMLLTNLPIPASAPELGETTPAASPATA
jgi:hypothetical protein